VLTGWKERFGCHESGSVCALLLLIMSTVWSRTYHTCNTVELNINLLLFFIFYK
jgi:hypothetical protein